MLTQPSCSDEATDSLHFEGISTDLMPTLLTMYDALYARLSTDTQPSVDLSSQGHHQQTTLVTDGQWEEPDVCQYAYVHTPVEGRLGAMNTLRQEPSRPVSSISSSSSSSSSAHSLVHGNHGGNAYLASAESLDETEPPSASTAETNACRRRDRRGIKARREKLRTGSDDSGVQCQHISLPAPPTLRRRYCDPNLSYMDRVVLEIIETEEIYVRDLHEVIEGYLHYWRQNDEPAMSCEILENLFSNMEQIFAFNKCFLADLSLCGTEPVLVAQCFIRHNRGFTIYTDYCTNYPRTVSVLTTLMRDESTMHSCRKRQLALSHTLPLGSYLLKPVQRVLKYHLLLGNIIKHFDKDRPGHADIWDALSAMTGMAHHINDMKRKHEHSVRVQEIQSLLYGWTGEDLTTFGELAAEGTFRTHGFKGLRHVFLFDKMLLLAKKKDQNILVYKTHILCSNLMLIESIPGEPLSFHVIPFDNPRLQYTLECRSMDQKREWSQQLKRVILENYAAAIPAHARQLVMELGQAKSDGPEGRSRRSHHAPEYLEKRKGRRRVSEIGLRNSTKNETPKNKKLQSRSSSCTRDSISKISLASISPVEKKQLKFPMWRRKSEPGVASALSLPNTPVKKKNSADQIDHHLSDVTENVTLSQNSLDASPSIKEQQTPSTNSDSESNTNKDTEGGTDGGTDGENLHEIVSHLLQHQLDVQKMILNKHRRNVTRRKVPYEASDTELEDRPPLPSSPPPAHQDHAQLSSIDRRPNYDNLHDIWLKRNSADTNSLYRTQSFKTKCENSSPCLPGRPLSIGDLNENFERPIMLAESATETYKTLHDYLAETHAVVQSETKFPNDAYDVPPTSYECLIDNIHPDHKIYSSHRRSFRKVFNKLTSVKSSKNTTPVHSTSDLSKKSSNLVCSVAKHYSKALKERVRQIRTEDDPAKPLVVSSAFAQIGARLAHTNEPSDYGVLNVQNAAVSRPDSVLSSSSFRTSSSTYSVTPRQPPSEPKYSDSQGDSVPASPTEPDGFYERSFDAIELENELFRDSAIYSDPEDNHDSDSTCRNLSLSPKNSFRYHWTKGQSLVSAEPSVSSSELFYKLNTNITTPDPTPEVVTKKTPPPVPCKPSKAPRLKGNLIEQHLKSLETQCTYSPHTKDVTDHFISLQDRKKLLETSSDFTPSKNASPVRKISSPFITHEIVDANQH